jgi:hypothetical protein
MVSLNFRRYENQILAVNYSRNDHFPSLPTKNARRGGKQHKPF